MRESETGYYHLKSRYYSPEVGRFLNADGIINAKHTGQFWSEIWKFAKTAVAEIGKAAVITTTIAVAGIAAGAVIGCLNILEKTVEKSMDWLLKKGGVYIDHNKFYGYADIRRHIANNVCFIYLFYSKI